MIEQAVAQILSQMSGNGHARLEGRAFLEEALQQIKQRREALATRQTEVPQSAVLLADRMAEQASSVLEVSKMTIEYLTEQLHASTQKAALLAQECEHLRLQMEENRQAIDAEKAQLGMQLQNAQQALEHAQAEATQLQEALANAETGLQLAQTATAQQAQANEASLAQLKAQIQVLKAEKDELALELGIAQEQTSETQSKLYAQLLALKEQASDEKDALQAQLRQLQEKAAFVEGEKAELLRRLNTSSSEVSQASMHLLEENARLHGKISELEQGLLHLEHSLKHSLDHAIAEKERWEQQFKHSQDALKQHQALMASEKQLWESDKLQLQQASEAKEHALQMQLTQALSQAEAASVQAKTLEQSLMQAKSNELSIQAKYEQLSAQPAHDSHLQARIAQLEQELEDARNAAEAYTPEPVAEAPKPAQADADTLKALALAQSVNETYFKHLELLGQKFANAIYCSYPSATYNGNVLHITDKFGITYMAFVKTDFVGMKGQLFSMLSNFALSHVINTKKYINSSRLIEEFFYSVKPSMMLFFDEASVEGTAVEIAICLFDFANMEMEFSSTGIPVYHEHQGRWEAIQGGEQDEASRQIKRFGLNNQYKVKKVNLSAQSKLMLSSFDMEASLPNGGTLLEAVGQTEGMGKEQACQHIQALLAPYYSKGLFTSDFLLVQTHL